MSNSMKNAVALKFGTTLDADNFTSFKNIIAPECNYHIGDELYVGPDEIAGLYEKNLIEGKAKFDKLVWGKCRIEKVEPDIFEVYFSDFLTHQGITHNYQCKQRITINDSLLVIKIQHIELPNQREALNAFYEKVGLK